MVMGQFVTTYRKDYLWPYVKTLGLRPEPERLYQPQYRDERLCACHCLDPVTPTSQQRTVLGPEAHDHEQWSRLGPMGPLLEPMVFPAKVSYSPEAKVARYNQPNVFLLKLQEKYPFIYECLRTAPPDDILARINKDRLSTTYEVDYCHKQEYPSAPYDDLLRRAGVEGVAPCPEPTRLPGDVFRPRQRATISNRVGGGKTASGSSSGSSGGVLKSDQQHTAACHAGFQYTSGITEYQDTYSRLGNLIIRDGLHDASRKQSRNRH